MRPANRCVGVGESRAEARHRLDLAQRADHRRLVVAEERQHVVGIGRQAGALGQKVEDAELARNPGVLHLEARVEVDDAVVPGELAAVDGDGDGGRQERLRGRADLEDGPFIDRRAAFLADAEALAIDQLVADDDADRRSRHVERLHVGADIGLEARHEVGDALLHAGIGRLRGAGTGMGERGDQRRRHKTGRGGSENGRGMHG